MPDTARMMLLVPWERLDGADYVHVEPASRRIFIHRADSAHVEVLDGWTGESMDSWPLDFESLPGHDVNDLVIINLVRSLVTERLGAGY